MKLKYVKSSSSVKPDLIDTTSSKTTVYIRQNIVENQRTDEMSGETSTFYEYQEAKSDYEEANAKLEKLKTKGRKQFEKIANMLQVSNKFIGYKAVHNYRADNNAGNTLIGNTIFFIDKNFEEITYSMEVDEYNQVQEAISSFKEQIEEEGE